MRDVSRCFAFPGDSDNVTTKLDRFSFGHDDSFLAEANSRQVMCQPNWGRPY